MVKHINEQRAAYVRLRTGSIDRGLPKLRADIQKTVKEIDRLQSTLANERMNAILHDQGLLFAWVHTRVNARRELEHLAQQPWFSGATLAPDGKAVRLTLRLRPAGRLLYLSIQAPGVPMVEILQPQETARQVSLPVQAVLDGLFADGHLAELVQFCAMHFGLELDSSAAGQPRQIPVELERAYFSLRGAWLNQPSSLTDSPVDANYLLERLNSLQRDLCVFDRQLKELKQQAADSSMGRAFEQELETLLALPEVKSFTVSGLQVEFSTAEISIQNVVVGSFKVTCDFERMRLEIFNQTQPRFDYEEDIRFDHPHVRQGSPCLGNIQLPVSDMLINRDLPRLVPLMLDFLKSYNSANPFRRLDEWMIA